MSANGYARPQKIGVQHSSKHGISGGDARRARVFPGCPSLRVVRDGAPHERHATRTSGDVDHGRRDDLAQGTLAFGAVFHLRRADRARRDGIGVGRISGFAPVEAFVQSSNLAHRELQSRPALGGT